ncbi:MAG TPA: glycosyltransferase, partial [Bacteroidales bacterium]|nr:glycosyltransferase [Bacteroidales bacterium]
WPPSGGAGVQRWLKFVKYLRNFGWEPVIYTPSNPEAPVEDSTLLEELPDELEVVKRHIWEPYAIYKRFTGQKKDAKVQAGFLSEEKKPGRLEKLSIWVRGNLFIPDARKYWINPSVKFLTQYLEDHPVDALVTTGPPHSMHMIGQKLHRRMNIPWLADFRDPWTGIDFYHHLMLSEKADRKHQEMERVVLREASAVVAVGRVLADELGRIGNRGVHVITNGYDEADIPGKPIERHKEFTIAHVGAMNKDRNHPAFWKAVRQLIDSINGEKNIIRIELIGKLDLSVKEAIEQNDLQAYTNIQRYLPHREAIGELRRSHLLYLPVNNTPNAKGILTGKLFEYLAVRHPILAVGPKEGEVSSLLQETKSGEIFDFTDQKGIFEYLKQHYEEYLAGNDPLLSTPVQKYSRKALTGEMAEILNNIVK